MVCQALLSVRSSPPPSCSSTFTRWTPAVLSLEDQLLSHHYALGTIPQIRMSPAIIASAAFHLTIDGIAM